MKGESSDCPTNRCTERGRTARHVGDHHVMPDKMNDLELLKAVDSAKKAFGTKCGKYSGSLTTEIIRQALKDTGALVSARDVFIRGLPIEIDLIIHRRGITPENSLLYEPQDVLVTIEVKNSGSFGDKTIQVIRQNCEAIRQANNKIRCCYLTLSERKGYKWAISEANSGCESYTLFWHSGSGAKRLDQPTGDWSRFLRNMRQYQEEA